MRQIRGTVRLLTAMLLLALPSELRAQVPGPASAGVATGDVAGSRPTFSWGAVPTATWYYLWVRDSTGADKLTQWYTAETLGCAAGPLCSVTLDLAMSQGLAEWWVQTWNASGFGPWSATRTVRVSSVQTGGTSAFFGSYAPANSTGITNTAAGAEIFTALTSGSQNVGVGYRALNAVTNGQQNVAVGVSALKSITTGSQNTALGSFALSATTNAVVNTAVGVDALYSNVTGSYNTAVGANALRYSTQDFNVGLGNYAGSQFTSGSSNIFLGYAAGSNLTGAASANILIGHPGTVGDNSTIRIGNGQGSAFISGVYASTVSSRVVYVDSNGRLGTLSSSRATKRNIRPLGDSSARLFDLRPVAFQYRSSPVGSRDIEYGLIAEEVAKAFPELVDRGTSGTPETVRYHLLTPLLLNELQKARADVDALMTELRELKARLASLEQRR
jgi:trimeric autotransporter adhesin